MRGAPAAGCRGALAPGDGERDRAAGHQRAQVDRRGVDAVVARPEPGATVLAPDDDLLAGGVEVADAGLPADVGDDQAQHGVAADPVHGVLELRRGGEHRVRARDGPAGRDRHGGLGGDRRARGVVGADPFGGGAGPPATADDGEATVPDGGAENGPGRAEPGGAPDGGPPAGALDDGGSTGVELPTVEGAGRAEVPPGAVLSGREPAAPVSESRVPSATGAPPVVGPVPAPLRVAGRPRGRRGGCRPSRPGSPPARASRRARPP